MPGTADENHIQVVPADQAIEMDVNQVEAGSGAPVTEQPRLDVLELQRLFEQGIVEQVDLSDGEIVRGAPPGIHYLQFGVR